MNLLNFKDSKNLFKKYNIEVKDTEIFNDKESVLKFAKKIGFPVILKVFSDKIVHKTEKGAVVTNINDIKELENVFDELDKKFKDKEGMMIQKQFDGREVVVGMTHDNTFGPIVMFGLGGIFVEILKDVSFRVCPINKNEALKMIQEIKSFDVLTNFRGKKKVNLSKLADLLINLSKLAVNEKEIVSIDFNPVFINEKEINVADFRIIIKKNA
ncbi:MAG: acetate--CoA ligase family protein [Candidatus Pacebacteria bacterium]|nr:acetate--CoA ligase family protein [Candidatus Paceibacterota bacterium]